MQLPRVQFEFVIAASNVKQCTARIVNCTMPTSWCDHCAATAANVPDNITAT